MKTFLHVGCGPRYNEAAVPGFEAEQWREVRFDIDPSVEPDVLGSMTNMSAVETESVDAIFSSHNIEHLYPHEVPTALEEFKRVLKPDGYVVLTCPDLQSVCALIAEDKLLEAAYVSAAGPIAPMDILYGHRPQLAAGNVHMAHKSGFTQKVLVGSLQAAGFQKTASFRRANPFFDLWIVATKHIMEDRAVKDLATQHFPQ